VLKVGPVRVLIADDHSLFAKTLEALLAGTPGLEVVGVAEDGLEAVGLAVALSPDVVLMDVEMPHLDGIAATRRLRELGLGLGLSIVVMSASDDPTLAEAAHAAGAKGYLTKDRIVSGLLPALLEAAEAPARLSGDGSAELAGRARVG
jgi:DNA-binding NarL/FixJ family response regulator